MERGNSIFHAQSHTILYHSMEGHKTYRNFTIISNAWSHKKGRDWPDIPAINTGCNTIVHDIMGYSSVILHPKDGTNHVHSQAC